MTKAIAPITRRDRFIYDSHQETYHVEEIDLSSKCNKVARVDCSLIYRFDICKPKTAIEGREENEKLKDGESSVRE